MFMRGSEWIPDDVMTSSCVVPHRDHEKSAIMIANNTSIKVRSRKGARVWFGPGFLCFSVAGFKRFIWFG